MSQTCQLIIYEPQKDPRIVDLEVDQPNSEENCNPVYNEDGSILEDYQLYLETIDNGVIKAPFKSRNKWGILKFFEKWKSGDGQIPFFNSVISDVPVSKGTHSFLKEYMINSTKKEKKIARSKKARNFFQAKKLKNKLKKQKKKIANALSAEEKYLPLTPTTTNHNIFTDCRGQTERKLNWKEAELSTRKKSNKFETRSVELKAPKKRRRRRKKGNLDEYTSEPKTSQPLTESKRLRKGIESCDNRIPESETINATRKIQQKSSTINTASNSIIENSSTFKPDNKVIKETSEQWNSAEPALDFIPIGNTNQVQKTTDFFSFAHSSDRRYSNNKNSFQSSQSYKNEFIGLSQKAFFLQC